MMSSLEKKYRRLLFAYPAQYRKERGDEIVSTLLDASPPARQRPSFRDARTLIAAGVHTRVRMQCGGSARDVWFDGIRMAALWTLATSTMAYAVLGVLHSSGWFAALGLEGRFSLRDLLTGGLVAVSFIALARCHARLGVLAFAAVEVIHVLRIHPWNISDQFGYRMIPIELISSFITLALVALASFWSGRRPTPTPWTRILLLAVAAGVVWLGLLLVLLASRWAYVDLIQFGLAFVFIVLTVLFRVSDPRMAICVTVLAGMAAISLAIPMVMESEGSIHVSWSRLQEAYLVLVPTVAVSILNAVWSVRSYARAERVFE
jgi:hypothetical protein